MDPLDDDLSSSEPQTPDIDGSTEPSPIPSPDPVTSGAPLAPQEAQQPPSIRTHNSDPPLAVMTSSSTPLGNINAARRPTQPPPLASRTSGFSQDIQAKMKAFSLSRQGTPQNPSMRMPAMPGSPGGQSISSGNIPTASSQSSRGPLMGQIGPRSPTVGPTGVPMAGGLANLKGIGGSMRPPPLNWQSDPNVLAGRMNSPKGGLAAKRGLNRGMKLSDATGPMPPPAATDPSAGGPPPQPEKSSDSAFSKYSEYVDTNTGTLKFKNKAVIHGRGIDFSGGSSFTISLDEVDNLDELGKGNYGTVYKVRHSRPSMRRPGQGLRGNRPHPALESLAVKVDEPPKGGLSGVVMAMKEIRLELDEAKFAAIIMELDVLHRCVSPFIIDFYGAFFQEGAVYICMEFMDGGSIDKLYGDGVPENVLRKITLSTVMGLKSLKDDHNIIHRDVKPTNILVNTKGQVKICDFGVSGNLVASVAKTNIGCQSYMAPERISGGGVAQAGANPGGGTYSVQSDIWSLALTIIECAMGRYPYPPETYNNIFSQLSVSPLTSPFPNMTNRLFQAIVDGDPPDLPAEKFSDAAHDFVRGCLNKIAKLRPTYAMLLRHGWLAPLMKPPTISEEDEESADATGVEGLEAGMPETADKEVATWVREAMERRRNGTMGKAEKPALHAVSLDAVPTSPLLTDDKLDGSVEGGGKGLAQAPIVAEVGGQDVS